MNIETVKVDIVKIKVQQPVAQLHRVLTPFIIPPNTNYRTDLKKSKAYLKYKHVNTLLDKTVVWCYDKVTFWKDIESFQSNIRTTSNG